jgi:hypothetical protein
MNQVTLTRHSGRGPAPKTTLIFCRSNRMYHFEMGAAVFFWGFGFWVSVLVFGFWFLVLGGGAVEG